MIRFNRITLFTLGLLSAALLSADDPFIEMVPVGHPGNPPDERTGLGSVDYEFYIAKYPITNAQYVEFLNAVARRDTHELYHSDMGRGDHGGIRQRGREGRHRYDILRHSSGRNRGVDMANMPVGRIDFYSAARFANWVMNGRPQGAQDESTTESGFYEFEDRETITNLDEINAQHSANQVNGKNWVAVVSENEWYKAAYYDPNNQTYHIYPTDSDLPPESEAPEEGSSDEPWEPKPGAANYRNAVGTFTAVGTYRNSPCPFGAFDMAGNIWERNDTMIDGNFGRRGGNFGSNHGVLQSTTRGRHLAPDARTTTTGFRISSLRPIEN